MALDNMIGNLCDGYRATEAGSMLHCDDLQAERIKNASLRKNYFYTADGIIYRMIKGVPHLAITREKDNPILQHLDDARDQLIRTGNYRPSSEDVASALASEHTVDIDLTQVRLYSGNEAEWRFLPIPTKNYSPLNPEERKLAERVHGSGDAFAATMEMLADAGIRETSIYVLNPEYVIENAKEAAIGRASWLNDCDALSNFDASVSKINYYLRLRGVRRFASVSEAFK